MSDDDGWGESDLSAPTTSWITFDRPYTGDVMDPLPPACGIRSPSGAMECLLPESGMRHHFEQHLGVDRFGNFRGWPDRR